MSTSAAPRARGRAGRERTARRPLTAAERRRVLVDWNGTTAEFRSDARVHDLIAEQAALRPDAPAVEQGVLRLSYAELEARASQLAHHLQRRGVGRGSLVAIALERSLETVVAVLAVLKTGAAYVPVDPSYPAERVRFMIEDAGAAVVLTEDELPDPSELGVYPATSPECPAGPRDLAYVVYTSGSTGRPKGVMVEHRGLCNLAAALVERFAVTPRSRVLQVVSFSFDAWAADFLMALTAGATLCLAGPAAAGGGEDLARALREGVITTVTLPPALLATISPEGLDALTTVCSAGDACPAELARRWAAGRRFLNGYGPTEASVGAAYDLEGPVDGAATAPIGRPIQNVRLYVLDEALEPVAPGTPGELCIGGAGVARGYLGRDDLTSERFVPDPFAGEPGARMYRTGDLARHLPDGRIEFLGRLDNQVKVRGLRIELEEIEAALRRQPEVADAAVAVDRSGQPRVVAAVVPANGNGPQPAALRAGLRESLPDWMVPAAIATVAALPLTPNGKVDRTAVVEATAASRARERAPYAAPRTPVEQTVVDLWRAILGLDELGVHDDVFELGADSLLATRVTTRLRRELGLELPLDTLFEHPTPEQLALEVVALLAARARLREDGDALRRRLTRLGTEKRALLERRLMGAGGEPSERIPRRRPGEPSPLSFPQQRLWFLDQWSPGGHTYNAALPMRISGPLDTEALRNAFRTVVERHEVLRTVYRDDGGDPAQVVLEEPDFDLREADVSRVPEALRERALNRVLLAEAQRPYDLASDVMMRALLCRLGDDEHALMIITHHIACDGWSKLVLFGELAEVYAARLERREPQLPELPIQYSDYALWQRRRLADERMEGELRWWRDRLAEAPHTLVLPADRERPRLQRHRGALHWFRLDDELTEAARGLGRAEQATPYMTLLAAFDALLLGWSGQSEVLVGSPIANRGRPETEPLIGFFVNTLVMQGDVSGNPTFRELVRRVRRSSLDAYAHQEVPFEKIVEALRPPRDSSRNPLVQVNFRVQASPPATLSLDGVEVEPLRLDLGFSRFDLALELQADANGMSGYLEYDSDLFEAATAAQFASDYVDLLRDATAAPDVPLMELPTMRELAPRRRVAAAVRARRRQ